jgi:hypothetical protein
MRMAPEHADLIARARQAFCTDPSYAITMAQQAHVVQARREPKKIRLTTDVDVLERSALSA